MLLQAHLSEKPILEQTFDWAKVRRLGKFPPWTVMWLQDQRFILYKALLHVSDLFPSLFAELRLNFCSVDKLPLW